MSTPDLSRITSATAAATHLHAWINRKLKQEPSRKELRAWAQLLLAERAMNDQTFDEINGLVDRLRVAEARLVTQRDFAVAEAQRLHGAYRAREQELVRVAVKALDEVARWRRLARLAGATAKRLTPRGARAGCSHGRQVRVAMRTPGGGAP